MESLANICAHVHKCVNKHACVHMCVRMYTTHLHACTCLCTHMCTMVCMYKSVCSTLIWYLLLVFYGHVCMCQHVSLYTYFYVWICSTSMIMQYCVICIAWAIIIVQLETLLVTTMNPIIHISMFISKLNLCTFHHINCNLFQLFPGLGIMVASMRVVHLKP